MQLTFLLHPALPICPFLSICLGLEISLSCPCFITIFSSFLAPLTFSSLTLWFKTLVVCWSFVNVVENGSERKEK
ncbi:MAG: hypothetical protein JOS17DRAFT_731025 [Linnemannia elongata]|nr:MAG: hypothetical protein JOS17DRAFT_731025 [Linnemannia elongata]